jgi:uncharacterized protein YbaR (Trm112 family)
VTNIEQVINRNGTTMAIDKELLDILCCPETKKELKVLSSEQLTAFNAKISAKSLKYKDGTEVDKPLEEALITVDGQTIYRVDDEIPIMLVEKGIPAAQLEDE